jgi:hypothetical protein
MKWAELPDIQSLAGMALSGQEPDAHGHLGFDQVPIALSEAENRHPAAATIAEASPKIVQKGRTGRLRKTP